MNRFEGGGIVGCKTSRFLRRFEAKFDLDLTRPVQALGVVTRLSLVTTKLRVAAGVSGYYGVINLNLHLGAAAMPRKPNVNRSQAIRDYLVKNAGARSIDEAVAKRESKLGTSCRPFASLAVGNH